MAFSNSSSGVCLNAEDLLAKINTFATSNGYTSNLFSDNIISGTTRGKRLHLSKNGKYYNICGVSGKAPVAENATIDGYYTNIQAIYGNISTAFDSAALWYNNTNANALTSIRSAQVSANANYWLYCNDKVLIVITKFTNTNYSTMIFGEINCYSAADSAFFLTASGYNRSPTTNSSGLLPISDPFLLASTSDLNTNIILNNSFITLASTIYQLWSTGNNSVQGRPFINWPSNSPSPNSPYDTSGKQTNVFTGTSVFIPIQFFILNASLYQPLGYIKDLSHIDFDKFQSEQVLTIGSNSYTAFPYVKKNFPRDYSLPGRNFGMIIKTAE